MKRYFSKAYYSLDNWEADPPHSCTIFEEDSVIDTGVLDANGDPIYYSNKIKLGFIK